jgi:hypothetical protein
MEKSKVATGKCLCGAVTVSFPLAKETFDSCHCGMCRKWSGGPALTVDGGTKVCFTGQDFITTYESSEWAERGFCKRCGTHLFYRIKESGFHNFPLGLLEDTQNFKFHQQIFIDMKPENYSFANKTDVMTQTEVFAKYSG